MSNFNRKDIKKMSIKELEDYIQKNSLNVQHNSNINLNNEKNDNNNKNDENILTNFLNYNYLDNKINQLPNKDDSKDEEIYKLLKENRELKIDMKKLFYLTDQNKNELEMKIKELIEENFNLKQEIHELKNKLILQTNILTNTEVCKHEIINEKQIMKEKYYNEIK